MIRKGRKLLRDPLAFFLDSSVKPLHALGKAMLARQTRRFMALGAGAADRKISVVMTAYNTGHLIEDAVRSVLAQTHSTFELMIIDDASTDDTLEILKKLKAEDPRIRLFHSPTNHGTYWSKNWCIRRASGDFIATHDSDDTSLPERLQLQLGALIDRAQAVACAVQWRRFTPEGDLLHIDGKKERMAAISLMFRRKRVLETIGYYDSVRISADTEFITRLERVFGHKNMRRLRQYRYRGLLRDGSLTTCKGSGFTWQAEGQSRRRELSGDRAAYHAAFGRWHKNFLDRPHMLKLDFPLTARTIEAAPAMLRGCDDADLEQVQEL